MPQLKAYHRPTTVQEALQLLSRANINTAIIGGGSYIVPTMNELVDEVVDLQAAGLASISYTETTMTLGAMVRLQAIVDEARAPALLRDTAHREGPNTLRNAATIGGTLASPCKDSELVAALLVYEATVTVQTLSSQKSVALPDFLQDKAAALGSGLITAVTLSTTGITSRANVARTPADRPIVAAVARQTSDGPLRLALCGVANTPVLVEPSNVKAAVNPPGDFKGSAEYRRQMAATLARRVVEQLAAATA